MKKATSAHFVSNRKKRVIFSNPKWDAQINAYERTTYFVREAGALETSNNHKFLFRSAPELNYNYFLLHHYSMYTVCVCVYVSLFVYTSYTVQHVSFVRSRHIAHRHCTLMDLYAFFFIWYNTTTIHIHCYLPATFKNTKKNTHPCWL